MTHDEWLMYQSICRSYDRTNFKGEDLFKELFETDDNGRIIFLKPPSTRHTSMEVFLFIAILMQHQHLRSMHIQASLIGKKLAEQSNELEALKAELKAELKSIKESK